MTFAPYALLTAPEMERERDCADCGTTFEFTVYDEDESDAGTEGPDDVWRCYHCNASANFGWHNPATLYPGDLL